MRGDVYYDRSGNLITLDEWASAFDERYGEKTVRQENVGDLWVSTVWLGLDHQHGNGPPLIFETMVFAGESLVDEFCDRYSTEAEAVAGHERVVAALEAGVGTDEL